MIGLRSSALPTLRDRSHPRMVRFIPRLRFGLVSGPHRSRVLMSFATEFWLAGRSFFGKMKKSGQFLQQTRRICRSYNDAKLAARKAAESLTGAIQHRDIANRSIEQTFERGPLHGARLPPTRGATFCFGVAMRNAFLCGPVYKCSKNGGIHHGLPRIITSEEHLKSS
jgi:hypothetical protein